jgi:putative Mg2+ transporter-C (MgtC) family protein
VDYLYQVVSADFKDFPDYAEAIRVSLRLLLAAVLGGLLGIDRKKAGKAAGIRTHMLVCLGAALFVLAPQQAGMSHGDLSRVIQGVVAGIGFLGAGAIIKRDSEENIEGLTTAAGIWFTAGIGISAGYGKLPLAVLGTVMAFLILSSEAQFSRWIKKDRNRSRFVERTLPRKEP